MSDAFYDFYKNQLLNIDYRRLVEIIAQRDVYIWGASKEGLHLFDVFSEHGVVVRAFIDNSIVKTSEVDVYSPAEILDIGPEKCFVIVSVSLKYENEITGALERRGFIDNRDYYYPYKNMSYVIRDLVPRRDVTIDKRYATGEKISESLTEDVMYFILMGGHIGDEALALSWINAYKEKHFVKKLVILTTSKFEGLSRLYTNEDDEVQVWDKDKLDALRVYSLSIKREKLNIIGANWCWIPLTKRIPFHMNQTLYKTMHLDLNYDAKSEYIKDISGRADVIKFINDNNLKRGKSVILVPYAQSVKTLSKKFWEQLAQKLSDKYEVYTNVAMKEEPVDGTKPLYIPLEMLPAVADHCGHIVTIRCGITDILALGQCEGLVCVHLCNNDLERNYAEVNKLYVNGKESVLYKNSMIVDGNVDESVLIEYIYDIYGKKRKVSDWT